jgi:hypothetical protein
MNYLKSRQRTSDKKWDYTSMNDGHAHPIGYCAGWREYSPEQRKTFGMNDKYIAELETRKDKYHAEGHDTPEEACACYKVYQLDTGLRFSDQSNRQEKCLVCNEWTTKVARVDNWESYVLCEKHANREEVEKLYNVFESCES